MDDEEAFCFYCQKQFKSRNWLKRHLAKIHPGSIADWSINHG